MTNSKLLPALFIAGFGTISAATIAFAQTPPADVTDPAPAVQTEPAPAVQLAQSERRGNRGQAGGRGGMMFGAQMAEIDADGDGAVTQDEIDLFRASLVAGADASGDGAIDLNEFQTIFLELAQDRMVDQFQNLDADGDGAVTQAEMDARFGGIVDRMDRNDDGVLNADDRGGRDHDGRRKGGRDRG